MFKQRQPFYKGYSQCQQAHCKMCRPIKIGKEFESSVPGKTYQVKATANCKSHNVVYVIKCKRWKKRYVGEMENALHIRMNGHRSDIKHQRLEKLVARHFNSKDHSLEDISIFVIEQIHREDANFKKKRKLSDPDPPIVNTRGT